MTSNTPAISTRPHLDKFVEKHVSARTRVAIAVDATASREPTWDMASGLTAQMFEAVANSNLDVQLIYYYGYGKCVASHWLSGAPALTAAMRKVRCEAGHTQIGRVLDHVRKENAREKVDALILISDACEEDASDLFTCATELNTPVFMFQEGNAKDVARIYEEIARLTKGAFCKFDSGAAARLSDLLRAVAAYASGGVKALANQGTPAARLLLGQIRK
jgi:hypothetical protein